MNLKSRDCHAMILHVGHSNTSSIRATTKDGRSAVGTQQKWKRKSLPLPVHCSTPKKASTSTSTSTSSALIVDSSKEDAAHRNNTSSCHESSISTSVMEDDVQDILKVQAWKLTSIIQHNGYTDKCAKEVHGLNEYEILSAQAHVVSLTNHEKNLWLLQIFFPTMPS